MFLLSILISFTTHLLLVALLPGLRALDLTEPPIPIEVVVIDTQADVRKLSAQPQQRVVSPVKEAAAIVEEKKVDDSSNKIKSDAALKPAGDVKPLVLPNFQVPESLVKNEDKVALPDVEDIPIVRNPDTFKGPDINSEISSQDRVKASATTQNKSSNLTSNTSGKDIGTDFFDFDEKPTNNRVILTSPPIPSFSLSNDTEVTVRFSIDKTGNTKDILFVKRSTAMVEELARDYVSRLQFNSVVYDNLDVAQITIKFKVR